MTAGATPLQPRWRWRTFAPTLHTLEERLGPVSDVAPRLGEETYVLHLRQAHNSVIRAGVLDIERLQNVDYDGLELWDLVFEAKFPLSAAEVKKVFEVWCLAAPPLIRKSYTEVQFLAEIASPHPDLHVARVEELRRGFALGGCTAELAEVRVREIVIESFCLEDENPERIMDALRELGLDSHANVNFSLGLKQALGLGHRAGASAKAVLAS